MSAEEIIISDGEYERFAEFFYQRTGIVFSGAKRYFVDRRLAARMAATGAADLSEYLMRLRFADTRSGEMQNLINAMTVNETYFYREEYQFRCLVRGLLPELTARRDPADALQIWSLPCSTGEEPYSIALYLLQSWPGIDQWPVRIIASDIDTDALERARRGIYEARALQYLSRDTVARYFRPLNGETWAIDADLREAVEFRKINITTPADMRRYRNVDVIFCRNLLIYFDDASRRRAADAMYEALRPGGFVCLGHSESMSRISSLFTVRKFDDAIVYQKPLSAEPQ